ncbi:hypothetical protein BFGS084_01566 [Bacteroides fragilis]|nr:hypothetical protein HMPREF1203_03138 [Bacteroides fragilis HMW 610]WMI94154.1 hypothetical protein BFGS084_01566 [Bacteroides fragilis]
MLFIDKSFFLFEMPVTKSFLVIVKGNLFY